MYEIFFGGKDDTWTGPLAGVALGCAILVGLVIWWDRSSSSNAPSSFSAARGSSGSWSSRFSRWFSRREPIAVGMTRERIAELRQSLILSWTHVPSVASAFGSGGSGLDSTTMDLLLLTSFC